ncbi:hypothetical protein [Streptomyces sp. NPDC051677]|uniref:hypothetical protein n=1 Tax=Streptomyces sp. NPDC051677 TaxID=3365669 RepID=UPI0037CE1D8D
MRQRHRVRRTATTSGRGLLAAVVATATAALTALPSMTAPAAAAEPAAGLSAGQRALAEAKESGRRVEVVGERTERTTVFANPDGYTSTLEESAIPVRVEKPGGGWQQPDATLVRRADGSVGPKAAAVGMNFSGGGSSDPLVSISEHGRSLSLDWPGKLPRPQLNGSSALYADVLPDVDLKVTATVEGFQHVLVVKTPKAAANKALKQLNFVMHSTGLTVRRTPSGALAAVDEAGQTVFRAPTAQMWNSAGRAVAARHRATQRLTAPAQTPAPADPAEAAPSGSGLEPGQGDKVALMPVRVSKNAVSVVPDA